MSAKKIKVVLAQLNLTVGDIKENTDKIISSIDKATNVYEADIVLFPELSICSYPPEDLLLRPAFHNYINEAILKIVDNTKNIHVLLGYPQKKGKDIYNACSVIKNQEIIYTYYKQNLPNYGVFDEKRYFKGGNIPKSLFKVNDLKSAVSICEDIWVPGPIKIASKDGAEIMFNISASPYDKHKSHSRKKMICKRAKESNMYIVYTNLVGGQDELVFDGNSMIANNQGEIIFHAPQFAEGIYNVEINLEGDNKKIKIPRSHEEESIYNSLVLGVRDYIRKNNFDGIVIGLSGGIDSALTLCIAVDALGAKNVEVLIMPSRYTADISIEDAIQQAKTLDVKYELISIERPFHSFLEALESRFNNLPVDLTEENIQARCRGIILMAVSNKTGKIVLSTGNKSEMAVGYATLYGDMAGGFAPLKDVWKTMVYKLAKWRNKKQLVIPERIIKRPPTAELKENQLDQDMLPEYNILDSILEHYIEKDRHPEQIIAEGFDADTVYEVVNMVNKNEYKRRQAAPGIRTTQRAFGRDRRYPITSGYIEKK